MNIYKKVPKPIKEVYRFFKRGVNRVEAEYWGMVIEKNPKKHAEHETRRHKDILLRPLNLDEPIYFNEKLLWLKYNIYNKSSLIAKCYNKYEVREYVKSKGLDNILNTLYGAWDNLDDVPWKQLPSECVIKISNGYAGHVFKRKGEIFNIKKAKRTLKATKRKYEYYYKITGDLFVAGTEQKIICEKMLHSNLGFVAPEDYKFYCFNGKPMFVEFLADRNGSSDYSYKEVFVDVNLIDRHELEGEAVAGTFEKPSCYDEMIEVAKILSADFPFVRVDLYVENGHPIFGELTFTPNHVQTRESEIEMGKLLDLSTAKIM